MTYTVKPGDSLSKIASQFGISWRDLYNTNKSVIGSNYNLIRPGQKYNIPGQSTDTGSSGGKIQSVSDGTSMGTSAGEENSFTPFTDIMSFDQYYNPNLARSSSEQIAADYYAPIVQQSRTNLEQDFANRGLTRSGMRGNQIGKVYGEIGKEYQSNVEQDMIQSEADALQEYNQLQSLYEESGGENVPTVPQTEGYNYEAPTVRNRQQVTSVGRMSPSTYGESYIDWITSVLHPKVGSGIEKTDAPLAPYLGQYTNPSVLNPIYRRNPFTGEEYE